jgi:acyl-[acyl-carrier-protein]-phospholipid O-acyltransferase/long-chain-fatty-acid--[acyl-carrier-protein] ligase
MVRSFHIASDAIRAGELVCVFAEGDITRTGSMLPFRKGMERIVRGLDAPIIPVNLHGMWGSIFSYERERLLWKSPKRVPYRVTVSFGSWLPSTASVVDVRQSVQALQAAAFEADRIGSHTLDRALVRSARRYPFRFCMGDARFPEVSFASMLLKLIFVTRRLRSQWKDQEMVGVLMPPSVGGALVNFAAVLLGKVPVNLNYTASTETLESCARQCGLQTVVTSKLFLEKLAAVNNIEVPGRSIYLEDVLAKPKSTEKVLALLIAIFLPYTLLKRALGGRKRTTNDLATVIFSSGSTGEPKGVMLSHYNIGSNIEQMEQVFCLDKRDRILGVLPFFHSFGFTGTLCLPAVLGVGAVYHANPLDAKTVGHLVSEHALTFLLATPTFLQLYLRGCAPEQFGSLRLVMAGAEKMPERLAAAFDEQFGIRPVEGYGCTECAPAVAVNTHDFRSAGFRQVGAKRGKIGHPLPGICVRIVDAETRAPVDVGQAGLLLVRGPNVMQGYLGQPEKTADVLRDGWYVTGDVATQDEDGFLQITDRLSRFSKIGGEMVPHIKVEERLHELVAATEQTFVVTSVPDEKKGERLIVLHKLADGQLQACLDKLTQSDLPNLWRPRADCFFHVESFPLLGTGKLDLRKVREVAMQFATT